MFEFSETCNYLMPAHFGGYEGQPLAATYHDVTSIMVTCETDRHMLESYVPGGFEITEPLVMISYALSRLPVKQYRECWVTRGRNVLRSDLARQLP